MGTSGARTTTYLGLAVGVLAVSTSAPLVRVAGDGGVPLLAIAFWRCAVGALVLAPFAVRARQRATAPVSPRNRRQMLASGILLAAHFALFIGSLSLTTVASSVTLVTMSPVLVALGATRYLDEPSSRRMWRGMLVSIAGALVIGFGDASDFALGPRALVGDVLAFLGTVAVAPYVLLGRVVRRDVTATTYNAVVFGIAAAVLLPVALLTGADLNGYDPQGWAALAGLVVGAQLLGHGLFNTLLARVPATVVSVVVVAEPVGATALAWWWLAELPTPLYWVGAPIALGGVLYATTGRRANRPDLREDLAATVTH